jgi:nucleoside-diphosphate-sugar epimerase
VKVLIVGGTGLISTPITRFLLERGDEVTLYNRGQRPVRLATTVPTIHGDRRDAAAFEGQMAAAGSFDCVIDMVCFQPAEAASAVRALRGRTGQYIFCSTVDVYQKPASRYPTREDEPHHPVSAYGVAKAECEALLMAAHARGDLAVTIIRPAHTYGEGSSFVHTFGRNTGYIDRIRKGKPIIVHGDGSSLWVSCHCEDVARAFVGARGNARVLGRAYHVTGDEWLTWNRHHQGVAEALDAPPPTLVHIPTDLLGAVAPRRAAIVVENFQFNNIFDNTAARADLGFQYTIPWIEGVRRTVAWLDATGRIENSDDDPFEDQVIAAWQRLGTEMARVLGPSEY